MRTLPRKLGLGLGPADTLGRPRRATASRQAEMGRPQWQLRVSGAVLDLPTQLGR